jgi:hypothetical protein
VHGAAGLGPVATGEAGLAVDRARLLADGRLAHRSQAGDLLVAQPLEEQARDGLLGGRELPALALEIELRAQACDWIAHLAPPARRLLAARVEVGRQPAGLDAQLLRLGGEWFPPADRGPDRPRQDPAIAQQSAAMAMLTARSRPSFGAVMARRPS